MSSQKLYRMVVAALLCAVGILIPMFSPIKIRLDPASFTLASHVALFLAMFVSPGVAVAVELGTTVGFLLAGFPPAVVLRALVQILFVVVGAYVLARKPGTLNSFAGMSVWVLGTGLLHAVAEALVSTWFYFGGSIDQSKGFFTTIILLVGVGTLAHHIVDFAISYIIWRPISKIIRIPASVHFGKAKS